MSKRSSVLVGLVLIVVLGAGCRTENPALEPPATPTPGDSPTAGQTESPGAGDPLVLEEGSTENGIRWQLVAQPGNPACVQLRRTDGVGDFMVCDEQSEQDFNGDERLRYAFGGLNDEQLPKFVIGITAADVARVEINVPEGQSPAGDTVASAQVPDRRFFVVELDPEPAQHVLAVRGLDGAGRTVAGFSMGEPEEPPSPLPTG